MILTHRTQERTRFFAGGVVFILSILLFLGVTCLCAADEAVYSLSSSNPSRDVWLFNTRALPRLCVNGESLEKIGVHRLDGNSEQSQRRWEPSHLDEFLQTFDVEVPTIIFIHGNYNSLAESIERATTFENYILREKHRVEDKKYRLLIWAWPSDDQVGGYLRDSKIKTVYSQQQGEYVAELLCRFPPESRVCLVGYCFGGITVCDTLERFLYKKTEETPSLTIRNLMFVPAVDPCSLLPRQMYGNVLPESEKTVILYNPKDFVLFWYPLTYGVHGRQPVGRQGIPWCYLPQETRSKVDGIDISPFAGRVHKFPVYFSNRNVNQKLTQFACFDNSEVHTCQ